MWNHKVISFNIKNPLLYINITQRQINVLETLSYIFCRLYENAVL